MVKTRIGPFCLLLLSIESERGHRLYPPHTRARWMDGMKVMTAIELPFTLNRLSTPTPRVRADQQAVVDEVNGLFVV